MAPLNPLSNELHVTFPTYCTLFLVSYPTYSEFVIEIVNKFFPNITHRHIYTDTDRQREGRTERPTVKTYPYNLCHSPQMIINQPPTSRACYFCDNSGYFIVQWHIKCDSYFKQKMLFIPPPNIYTCTQTWFMIEPVCCVDILKWVMWWNVACLHEAYIMF